jgi:predicted nicotinamide N-methyase
LTADEQAGLERFIQDHTAWGFAPMVPELKLLLATEVTPLWQATEDFLQRHNMEPPFWAFAWPGAQAFARWMLDAPGMWAGARVLDLGGGSGLAAIAAARCGAEVTLVEVDPLAGVVAGLNAAANGVSIEVRIADMLDSDPRDSLCLIDVVVVGDLFYSRPLAERVVRFLRAAAVSRQVFLADPGRKYVPTVGVACTVEFDVPVLFDLEGQNMKKTRILRVGADAGGPLFPPP